MKTYDDGVRDLMANVAIERLEYARNCDPGDEKGDKAFEQGMAAAKEYTELTEANAKHEEELAREENRLREAKRDRWVKGIEIGATVLAVPLIGLACNRNFAKFVGRDIEQFEIFTSTPGRSLSKMFKFPWVK